MALDDLIDEINAGEERERPERDEFVIDGLSVPAASAQATDTSRFEQKLTVGDYSKDSDQLMSSWILTSHVGGAMLKRHTEGATDQRFRWAHAWTMNPEQLALPPRVRDYAPTPPAIASGDTAANGPLSVPLAAIGDWFYFSEGKSLKRVKAHRETWTGHTVETLATLGGYPQGRGAGIGRQSIEILGAPVPVAGFWIPLGEQGVEFVYWFTGGGDSVIETPHLEPDVKAVALASWDDKVFALTTDGYLRVYLGPVSGFTWEEKNEDLRLPYDEEPRGLEVFYDRSGNQTVFLATNKRIWAYDPEAVQIYPVSLEFPRHRNNGLGFTTWRDDALYISTGYGIARYSRDGVRTDIGLDRDDGIAEMALGDGWGGGLNTNEVVPSRTIVDLIGTQNFLVALVQLGTRTVGSTVHGDYAVMAWNEAGWHILHEDSVEVASSASAVGFPSRAMVVDTVAGYRLWWGYGARKHSQTTPTGAALTTAPGLSTMALPRSFHGPKHQVLEAVDEFATSGYLYTGWFDAGMLGFLKSWSHAELTLVDPEDGQPVSGSVTLEYRTDLDPSTWTTLGTASAYGRTVLPFNLDADGFPQGEASTEIEFRLTLATTDQERSPIVESLILKFIKLPLPGRAWLFNVPLDAENLRGLGPQEISDKLSRLTYSGTFSKLLHQGRVARVRFAQHQVVEGVGDNPFKQATVNVIEVPIPGYAPWDGGTENE